jgi:hypothetical protein
VLGAFVLGLVLIGLFGPGGMDWSRVIVAGVAGALAAGGAHLVVRAVGPALGPAAEAIGTVLLFFALSFLGNRFLGPTIRGWQAEKGVDAELERLPAFRDIRKIEPAAYEAAKTQLVAAIREGKDVEREAFRIGSEALTPVMLKYLPRASDDALLHFQKATAAALQEVLNVSPDAAFAFLFPASAGAIRVPPLSKPVQTEMLDAMSEVIVSGAATPQPPSVDPVRAQALLQDRVLVRLLPEHAAGLMGLANANRPDVDRAAVARAMLALQQAVLSLPRDEALEVFRFMATNAAAAPTS